MNTTPSWSDPPLAIANKYHDHQTNQPKSVRYRLILVRVSDLEWLKGDRLKDLLAHTFFSSSVADVALWLGSYMSISSKRSTSAHKGWPQVDPGTATSIRRNHFVRIRR